MSQYEPDWGDDGIFVVIVEGGNQGPMILETEGFQTSREAAEKRARKAPWARTCIAKLTYASGNALLFKQTKDMQE